MSDVTKCSKKQQANAINKIESDKHHALIVETICFNNRLLTMNEKLLEFLLEPRSGVRAEDL